MPVLPVIILTVIIHIALLGTDIFMTNLWVHTPWYGGETGFMPTGKPTGADGETTHPYDVVSNFLRGGEDGPQSQTDNLKDGSGLKIFQWIVRTPLCMLSTLIRFQLSLTTFTYDIVRILPDDGFGYWIQMAIPMVGYGVAPDTAGTPVGLCGAGRGIQQPADDGSHPGD